MHLLHRAGFRHGIHPPDHKRETRGREIRRLPFPDRLMLPLNQHIGKPAIPLVTKGQEVVRGEKIAEADGYVSAPLHAPATGRIRGIELMPTARGPRLPTILLDVYEASTQEVLASRPMDPGSMDRAELIRAVQDIGLAGLGGAEFPSHVKLAVPEDKRVDTLMVNGCECEPYLTCDHRLMLEQPENLIRGIRIAMRITGTRQAIIGIEDNKPAIIGSPWARPWASCWTRWACAGTRAPSSWVAP
jgi:electron transport complex protein RnfC